MQQMKFDCTDLSAIRGDDAKPCPRHPPRAILTEQQAAEIYQFRISNSRHCPLGSATVVARRYNVSPKAVRDIWNRRTWTQETRHLWSEDEAAMVRRDNRRSSSNPNSSDSEHDSTSGRSSPDSLRPACGPIAWIENRGGSSTWCDFLVKSIKRSESSGDWPSLQTFPADHPPAVLPAAPAWDLSCCCANAAGCSEGWGSASHWRWEAETEAWGLSGASEGMDDPFHGDWPHW